MDESNVYTPPDVWEWELDGSKGGTFSSINRPIAGATHEKDLPIGEHPLQLYSLGTPNGVKITIMLEELLAVNRNEAEYDAWLIEIEDGEQFSTGFVKANPNSKIPVLVDHSVCKPTRVFESGAILLYLAEKFDAFVPKEYSTRAECLSWLFWQIGSTPYLGGGFGHFYRYAPTKMKYPIDRYAMEVKRQMDVLDQHLVDHRWMCGNDYTIADMAIWPWYGALALGEVYDAGEFLDVGSYQNIMRWAKEINERPPVKLGKMVNRTWGNKKQRVAERHSKSDFDHIVVE